MSGYDFNESVRKTSKTNAEITRSEEARRNPYQSSKRSTLGQVTRNARRTPKNVSLSGFRASPTGAPSAYLVEPNVGRRGIRGRSGRGGGVPSRMQGFTIDPQSIAAWFEYAMDFKENAAQFQYGMDRVMMMYAALAAAAAQKRSLGPVDPLMQNMAASWKIPVRRITGAYFSGWRIEHVALGVWALTNDSREAYYIEFGINHQFSTGARGPQGQRLRIRRPIMKLAVMEAVKIVQATNAHINQVVSVVGPSGIYQSPRITGAIKEKGATGSAIGLVDINALKSMVTAGGGSA